MVDYAMMRWLVSFLLSVYTLRRHSWAHEHKDSTFGFCFGCSLSLSAPVVVGSALVNNCLKFYLLDKCASIVCHKYKQCVVMPGGRTECVCSICHDIYNPICGSDGKTHASECWLRYKACEYDIQLKKVSSKPCGKCTSWRMSLTTLSPIVCFYFFDLLLEYF